MKYNLLFQSEVILEIEESFEWYEEQGAGLGYRLMKEIEVACEKISLHPHHYPPINKKYRRIQINYFPYILIYETEDNNVNVISLRHSKRKPKE